MKRYAWRVAAITSCLGVMAESAAGFELIGIHFDSGDLYTISTLDASLSPAGSLGVAGFGGLEMGPDGFLYGFTTGASPVPTLYRIDAVSYDVTPMGQIDLAFIFEGSLVFATDGTAYAVSNNGLSDTEPQLFTVDLNTGQGAFVGIISGGSHDINGMVWRSDGMLVGIDRVTNALLTIDPSDATSTLIVELDPIVGIVGGMAAVGDTAYFSTAGPDVDTFFGTNSLYEVDLFTGEYSLVGSFEGTISGTGISGLAIPEPATILLLLLGAGAIVRRRP